MDENATYVEAQFGDPNPSHRTWVHANWVRMFPLHRNTVLDYIRWSEHYDRTSSNEQILMQNAEQSRMKDLEGVEFAVDDQTCKGNDKYCVVRKQWRKSPDDTELLDMYFVKGEEPDLGTMYPMPTLHSVVSYNLMTCIHYANEAFEELKEAREAERNAASRVGRPQSSLNPEKEQQRAVMFHSATETALKDP